MWHTIGRLLVSRSMWLFLSLTLVGCQSEIGGGPGVGDLDAGVDAGGTPPLPDASEMLFEPDAAPPCVEGDVQGADPATGICYWVSFATQLDWAAAQTACEQAGGKLATITTAAESEFVNSLAVQANADSIAAAMREDDYWISARDSVTEGTFLWDTGETLEAFDNWRAGEPNDGGTNGEDCAIVEADNGGTWDDRGCSQTFGHICER